MSRTRLVQVERGRPLVVEPLGSQHRPALATRARHAESLAARPAALHADTAELRTISRLRGFPALS